MLYETLLNDIADGNEQAFRKIYNACFQQMINYATGLLSGDRSAAEDVVNESFFAIWEQADRFNGTGSAEGWMRRIVRNKAVDWIRKQREKPMTSALESQCANESADSSFDPFERVAQSTMADQLRNALSVLSIEHREAVWLCYFEELSISEIAAIAGCPENTIKTRLFHARKILGGVGLPRDSVDTSDRAVGYC